MPKKAKSRSAEDEEEDADNEVDTGGEGAQQDSEQQPIPEEQEAEPVPMPQDRRLYRNRKGTKAKDLYSWETESPKLLPIAQMPGFTATQQYLQQLIRRNPADIKTIIALPKDVDEITWIYEHFRQVLLELNDFVVAHNEDCTGETNPSMRITINEEEFVFLCSGFEPPMEVPAIDYMTNTIAHSASILSSNKLFPSRVMIDAKQKKHFKTIARRIYRIFAFSYFHYPHIFDAFESQTHLCERYSKFLKLYKLMSSKVFLIPDSRWKQSSTSQQ